MLKAIIFDVDGTLAETEETHRAAFNLAFEEAGLPWRWDEALYGELLKVTGGKERLAHFIGEIGDRDHVETETQTLIGALHRRKTAIYSELLSSGAIKLRLGVGELIEGALADGVRLAIATTTSRPNVETLLRQTLGAHGGSMFEAIAAGDDVRRKKPSPEVFRLALDSLQLPPELCVAIEDSANGLRSAIGAGLATLVTPSVYSRDDDFTGAALVVDNLTELVRSADVPTPAAFFLAVRQLHRKAASVSLPQAHRSTS